MPTATVKEPLPSHPKDGKFLPKNRQPLTPSWVGRVPQLKPGRYADGMPIHQVKYLGCKLILRPNHFNSRKSLFEFGDVMQAPAKEHGVRFTTKGFWDLPLKIREICS